MAQDNLLFLAPEDINAMDRNGDSIHFSPDNYDRKYDIDQLPGTWHAFNKCEWPACGIKLPFTDIPLCREHSAQVWAHVQVHETKAYRSLHEDEVRNALVVEKALTEEHDKYEVMRREGLRQSPGHVYYLSVGDLVKIGFTTDMDMRMRAYPPNATLLALHPGTLATEKQIHHKFLPDLRKGREWFAMSPSIRAHIEEVKQKFPVADSYRV